MKRQIEIIIKGIAVPICRLKMLWNLLKSIQIFRVMLLVNSQSDLCYLGVFLCALNLPFLQSFTSKFYLHFRMINRLTFILFCSILYKIIWSIMQYYAILRLTHVYITGEYMR